MSSNDNNQEELMELAHEAVPGFDKAFYLVFVLALVYLALILLKSASHGGGHV